MNSTIYTKQIEYAKISDIIIVPLEAQLKIAIKITAISKMGETIAGTGEITKVKGCSESNIGKQITIYSSPWF